MSANASRRLNGRVAIVTGGAQGIGFGIASRLAEEGAVLVIADINEKNAREAARRIDNAGGTASAFAVDIGDDFGSRRPRGPCRRAARPLRDPGQ